ncbi:MAG: phage protease [Methylobacter sp.]
MDKKQYPPKSQLPTNVGIAACSFELDGASTDVRVVPAGNFRGRDGRPTECASWNLTEAGAMAILAARSQQQDKFLFDYNHQTLYVEKTGQKAPAAGWGTALEWRPGDGIYAIATEWTPTAQQEIENKEFRYISPVITYNKTTGEVTGLLMASLVNYASLDDLCDLAAMAALQFLTPQEPAMDADELMERLIYMLNLPVTSTPAEIATELDKVKAMIMQPDGTTAGLAVLLTAKNDEIAALSANVSNSAPDPLQYAPVAVVRELREKLAALSGDTLQMQVRKLVDEGVASGKIIGPAEKDWAFKKGMKDMAALQADLDNTVGIAALAGMQTGGKPPVGADQATTTEDAAKQKYQSTAALQAEFGDEATYLAYIAADASGSVKILGGKK